MFFISFCKLYNTYIPESNSIINYDIIILYMTKYPDAHPQIAIVRACIVSVHIIITIYYIMTIPNFNIIPV